MVEPNVCQCPCRNVAVYYRSIFPNDSILCDKSQSGTPYTVLYDNFIEIELADEGIAIVSNKLMFYLLLHYNDDLTSHL